MINHKTYQKSSVILFFLSLIREREKKEKDFLFQYMLCDLSRVKLSQIRLG